MYLFFPLLLGVQLAAALRVDPVVPAVVQIDFGKWADDVLHKECRSRQVSSRQKEKNDIEAIYSPPPLSLVNITLGSEEFSCVLPPSSSSLSGMNLEGEADEGINTKDDDGLYLREQKLSFVALTKYAWMFDHCYIFVRNGDEYWTFEVCVGSQVTQYHISKKYSMPRNLVISLGVHDSAKDIVYSNGTLIQFYTDGTEGRKTRITFSCSLEATTVESVVEPSIRRYEIKFTGSPFCNWADPLRGPSVDVLTASLEGQCVNYTASAGDYWSYEFCHPDSLVQFHRENSAGEVSGPMYLLGTVASHPLAHYNSASSSLLPPPSASFPRLRSPLLAAESSLRGKRHKGADVPLQFVPLPLRDIRDPPYKKTSLALAMDLHGGTPCDETGQPRQTRVLFFCPGGFSERPANRIVRIEETTICQYDLYVAAPVVCAHPRLRPVRPPDPTAIRCYSRGVRPEVAGEQPKVPRAFSLINEGEIKEKGKQQLKESVRNSMVPFAIGKHLYNKEQVSTNEDSTKLRAVDTTTVNEKDEL